MCFSTFSTISFCNSFRSKFLLINSFTIISISLSLSEISNFTTIFASLSLPAALKTGAMIKPTSYELYSVFSLKSEFCVLNNLYSKNLSPLFLERLSCSSPNFVKILFSSTSGTISATVPIATKSRYLYAFAFFPILS